MEVITNKPTKQKTLMLFSKEARERLIRGVELTYQAVCSTLSPKGRNVAINRTWGTPIIVHDGITTAREVKDPDKFVQMGINLVKEAAAKTNDIAGDGTTTTTLIAREVVQEGFAFIDKGSNPMILREQILQAKNEALEGLKNFSRPVKNQIDLERVAYISSADEEIGKLVGSAVYKAGDSGLVTVDESGGYDTYVEHTDGMSIDKGYISPYFVTNPRRMEAILDKPYIIITDRNITTNNEIAPIVEALITKYQTKDILLIATVSGQALKTLVTNKLEGTINCLVVKPPKYGENVKTFLEDIAIVTGGRVISEELGYTPEKLAEVVDEGWFGRADKVVSDKNVTTIVGGRGDKKEVKKQIKNLKEQLKKAVHTHEKEIFTERIAKLSTGISVIRVGAKTEVDAREKVERVKDAVGSAQSAKEEGVVSGAGTTFLRLQDYVTSDTEGAKVLRRTLGAVVEKILINSGEEKVNWLQRLFGRKGIDELIREIKTSENENLGYEVLSGKLVDLQEEGVIDPTKVIRLCLENGCAVATMILTTDTLIDYPEYLDNVKP